MSSSPNRSRSRRRSNNYRKITLWGVAALVALRVCIGWHFFQEGASKVREGGFSSVGFLGAAQGPLAPYFQGMIPDFDGALRLDKDKMTTHITAFGKQVKTRYGFDEAQTKRVDSVIQNSLSRLDGVHARWSSEIKEHQGGFERMAQMKRDPKRNVASLRSQKTEIETKWRGLVRPALSEIDKILDWTEKEAVAIATPEQQKRYGLASIPTPGAGLVSVEFIDRFIPIFDMTIGILLIIGLLTPVAATAGGLFLLSVVLTQFPGYPGSQPTYYQAIEMIGCFVLAAADAGRYAGLDFFPWSFWNWRSQTVSSS